MIKRVKYLPLIALFIGFSCSGQPEKKEVISMEDFAGEIGEEPEQSVEEEQVEEEIVYNNSADAFIGSVQAAFDTSAHAEFHPIDRFTYNNRKKISFKSKTNTNYGDIEVTPQAELYYYTFSDSVKTKNAFYNWLDCFGSDCAQVKLNQDQESIKMPPLLSLVYDTLIVAVDYRCEDKSFDWSTFEDSLINQFGNDYKYRVEVGCGGPLSWK